MLQKMHETLILKKHFIYFLKLVFADALKVLMINVLVGA